MYKEKVYKYYQNQIDNINDEEKRDKLLDMLEDIDTMLFELETDIDEEIEEQEEREEQPENYWHHDKNWEIDCLDRMSWEERKERYV